MVESQDPKVREFASSTLAVIGSEESLSRLLRAIRQETDPLVRENMAESLHGVRNPAAVPALARCAQDTSDLALHRQCRNAISAMEDPQAANTVIALLETGGTDSSLEPLAYALRQWQHESAVSALVGASWSGNERTMSASIAALAHIGTPGAVRALFAIIGSGNGGERATAGRAAALKAAAERPDTTLISTFEEVLGGSEDELAVGTAIDCLVLTPSIEAVQALARQSVTSRDIKVRAQAQAALTRHQSHWRVSR